MRYGLCALLLVAITAGLATPANAQLVLTPHLDARLAGDVEPTRGGAGLSVGYYVPAWRGLSVGLELDASWHGHFFRDEEVAHLVPEGVDLNTDALLAMGRLVVPVSIPRAPIWRPYGSLGLGMTHAIFTVPGSDEYDAEQDDFTFSAGIGLMHQLTRLLGLRAEAGYYHAFVSQRESGRCYGEDYDFWMISVGIMFQVPPEQWPDAW
jgi:hypothetical protein